MTNEEILSRLRRHFVDGVHEWDADPEAFTAALEQRLGCLSAKLTAVAAGYAVTTRGATGDVHYYSMEIAIRGPADRFALSSEDLEAAGGEALYLVVYCSTLLPLVEARWHFFELDRTRRLTTTTHDLFDDHWLSERPAESALALKVAEAFETCGWQLTSSELMDERAPADWPWPLPAYDYQSGEYLVRDYVIKGMRDY